MSTESVSDHYSMFSGTVGELNLAANNGWRVVHVVNVNYWGDGTYVNALLERIEQEESK